MSLPDNIELWNEIQRRGDGIQQRDDTIAGLTHDREALALQLAAERDVIEGLTAAITQRDNTIAMLQREVAARDAKVAEIGEKAVTELDIAYKAKAELSHELELLKLKYTVLLGENVAMTEALNEAREANVGLWLELAEAKDDDGE